MAQHRQQPESTSSTAFDFSSFQGFESPLYTQVPDQFIRFAPHLGNAALRVGLYIIHHTFGYKKESDRISMSQMCQGIRSRKDGTIIDEGTGMVRSSVWRGINELLEKNIIEVVKGQRSDGGNDVTEYRLKMKSKGGGFVKKLGVISQRNQPRFRKETHMTS